jgi:hypothetical protein
MKFLFEQIKCENIFTTILSLIPAKRTNTKPNVWLQTTAKRSLRQTPPLHHHKPTVKT